MQMGSVPGVGEMAANTLVDARIANTLIDLVGSRSGRKRNLEGSACLLSLRLLIRHCWLRLFELRLYRWKVRWLLGGVDDLELLLL